MTFFLSKKPPFEKTSSFKTKSLFYKKYARRIFGIFGQNHGLTPLKICKFFDYSKIIFPSRTMPPCEKKDHQTTKPRSLLQKTEEIERNKEFLIRLMG